MLRSERLYEKLLYMAFIFFTSAILGGIIEILYVLVMFQRFDIGGFMYGPWRPIYGWGAVLLYFITRPVKENKVKVFFLSIFICSLFEYVASIVLEIIFQRLWWDYSNAFLNINGRVCLTISCCWGVLGLVFTYGEVYLKKLFSLIGTKKMAVSLLIIYLIYKVDGLYSWLYHMNTIK